MIDIAEPVMLAKRPVLNLPLGRLFLGAISYVYVIAFIGLPLGMFLMMGFWRLDGSTIVHELTLQNYAEFFVNDGYRNVFLLTVKLALQAALIGTVCGYLVAYFTWRRTGWVRYFLLFMSIVPLFMNYIIKLYAIRSLLGPQGVVNALLQWSGILDHPSSLFLFNEFAILVAMTLVYLPFTILPIFLALERIPSTITHASEDLGASGYQTFRHVILPLTLPGTIVGSMFSFLLALGDFVIPQMVGGTQGFTFGRVIWSQFGLAFNWPFGAAMASVLLILALVIVVASGMVAARDRSGQM